MIKDCPQCRGRGEITLGSIGEEWVEKCQECEVRLTGLETEIIDAARNLRFMVHASHHGPMKSDTLEKARQWLYEAVDKYESELLP